MPELLSSRLIGGRRIFMCRRVAHGYRCYHIHAGLSMHFVTEIQSSSLNGAKWRVWKPFLHCRYLVARRIVGRVFIPTVWVAQGFMTESQASRIAKSYTW